MIFSIIIPTYNEHDFIGSCLQSVLRQRFPRSEFEIIVADSHSTDGTADLAARFADRVLNIPRNGIAHARNAGSNIATGDILVFVDADVTLQPDFLSLIHNAFVEKPRRLRQHHIPHTDDNPHIRISAPPVAAVCGRAIPSDGTWFARFVYLATYVLVETFNAFGVALFPGLCVAYNRNLFQQIGGFREDFGVSEDLDVSRRIASLGTCVYEPAARASVSTRRLARHALSTVLFHIYHDLRYLFFGKTARFYPKAEELNSAADLWRLNRKKTDA